MEAKIFAMFQSLIQYYPAYFHSLAMRRVKSWMDATKNHAVADGMVCLNFLARRRLRWSHASVNHSAPGQHFEGLCGIGLRNDFDYPLGCPAKRIIYFCLALRLPAKAGARDKLRHHRRRYDAATGEILTISATTRGAPSRSWMSAV